MKLVAGLGNPGQRYEKTKHNTGFMALDYFARKQGFSLDRNKFSAQWTKQKIGENDVLFLEPQTDMNASGIAIAQASAYFKIAPEDMLIIHDDMDMPIGKIRLRRNGKSGGHNGLKSIIAQVNSQNFNRLKIGIQHPQKMSVVNWVLSPFDTQQSAEMQKAFATASEIILSFCQGQSIEFLMNKYN